MVSVVTQLHFFVFFWGSIKGGVGFLKIQKPIFDPYFGLLITLGDPITLYRTRRDLKVNTYCVKNVWNTFLHGLPSFGTSLLITSTGMGTWSSHSHIIIISEACWRWRTMRTDFSVPRLVNLHKITPDGIGEQYSVNMVSQGGQRTVLGPPRVVSSNFLTKSEFLHFVIPSSPLCRPPEKFEKVELDTNRHQKSKLWGSVSDSV